MAHTPFKRILSLITITTGLLSLPIQAIFESLTLTTWKPDDSAKEIEIFTAGDSHVGEGLPEAENSKRDAQDTELLQSALHSWNIIGNVAYLGESNPLIAKQNSKVRQEQLQNWKKNTHLNPPYWGMYYTIPEYIDTNKKQLSNIAFNMCDSRGKAFFETKAAILTLQKILARLEYTMRENKSIWIEKDALQQNMNLHLKNATTVSAQDFLNELKNAATTLTIATSDKSVDEITQKELELYAQSLNKGITDFEIFFKKQLNNELQKSTFEAIVQHVITAANLDKENQTNRETAFSCMSKCLSLLKTFNEQYEKITNYVADAGFILALQKQRKTNDKIVMFLGNNHTTAIFGYLNKYKSIGKAYTFFSEGSLEYNYGSPSKRKLSHEQARNLFCIPFNKNFLPKEISLLINTKEFSEKIKPYLCKNCSKISVDKQFQYCSQCKDTYYCSKNCQKNNWSDHKTNCKKASPLPILTTQVLPIVQTKSQLPHAQDSQKEKEIKLEYEQNEKNELKKEISVSEQINTVPITLFGYKIFSDNSTKK